MAFSRIKYGQVEPNQLSAQKTGQIYASLPLAEDVAVLQNGEFMYYDYKSGTVTADGVGEPMLVFNEIKIYEPWLSYKDFAMFRVGDNYVTSDPMIGRLTSANADGTVFGDGALTKGADISVTLAGEDGELGTDDDVVKKGHTEYGYRMDGIAPRLFKTNIGDIYTTNMVDVECDYEQGDVLKLKKTDRNTLELSKDGDIDGLEFVVAKVYTMPDGQPGLKLQRIA